MSSSPSRTSPSAPRGSFQRILRAAISFLPWTGSLYLLYWLEYGEVWPVDMAFRSVFAVLLLALGMLASFLLHTALSKKASAKKHPQ